MGRGITMDEWVHFDRLPDEGRVPNSSYWYVHCRHCVRGFEQKQLFNPPAKLTGRRSAMKAHLKICPMYATQYKMEQRALAAAAAAAAATTAAAEGVEASTDDSSATTPSTTNITNANTNSSAVSDAMLGTVTIKTQSGEKRKRRGEDVEASGPRGGRGKHCMMEEWEHFIRLQDEGYIGKSNFFYAVCRHCQAAHDDASDEKKPLLVPDKLVGRREKMRKHLSMCPHFKGELPSMERRTPPQLTGIGTFLPLATSDGVKMVPVAALATSAFAMDAAGLATTAGDGQEVAATSSSSGSSTSRLALDEWQFFTRLHRKKDSAYYFARCNFCQQAYANAPETLKTSMSPTVVMGRKSNMQTHLAKCPYVPKDAVLMSRAAMLGRGDEFSAMRLKIGEGTGAALHQAIVEVLLQHRLPFEWVDSTSAKKLLRFAATGANWHTSMLPTSVELRGQVLDDLVRDELQPEVEKIKQTVTLPSMPTAAASNVDDSGTPPATHGTVHLPVALKLALAKGDADVPTAECFLTGHGIPIPVQYVIQDREEPMDEESLMAGITPTSSRLAYFHGLDLARCLVLQSQRLKEDQHVTAGVIVASPSPVVTRAAGVLHARLPEVVMVWDLQDIVSFALQKALGNPDVVRVVTAASELLRTPEIQAALSSGSNGAITITSNTLNDWVAFASVAPELVGKHVHALSAVVAAAVNHGDFVRVIGLLRAFSVIESTLAVDGRVGVAETLTHLATLYTAAEGFAEVQRALEVAWNACEQPLYLLAHALHPQLRLRGVSSTDVTKLSMISDLSVAYFSQLFAGRKPLSLRGDVTSFLHQSQPVFTDSFIAEFPLVDDYFRYLRDNFAELSALMQLLQTLPVGGVESAHAKETHASPSSIYTDEEHRKLSMLAERWGVERIGSTQDDTAMDAAVDEDALVKDATTVATWLRKLEKRNESKLVDFTEWEAACTTFQTESAAPVASEPEKTEGVVDIDVPLPALPRDDDVLFPARALPPWRSTKTRLAQLFSASEATTV